MSTRREHWGSKVGFIMATAGSAVGLGSLWRFPYIIGENGGGAFVLLYFLFTLIIGVPIFVAEVVMGRSTQRSTVMAFDKLSKEHSQWKMIGWLNILTNFIILSFYSVVAGWGLNYGFMSLNQFTKGKTPEEIKNIFNVVYSSGDISIFWHFIFMLMTIGVVYAGIKKGIEYWSKILMPALFIFLIGLFVFATTLPGFGEAFRFTLYPDFKALGANGVLNALGMSFWTLSIGLGIILTYGSYMRPDQDIPKTGVIIAVISALVSIFAALMIFPVVFSFGFAPEGGPGLVFQILPVLFNQLPATLLLSTVFFALFLFAALTSSISILEVLASNFMEVLNWSRHKAVWVTGIGAFIFGIPSALSGSGGMFSEWTAMYGGKTFFDTMSYITASWMMPLAGIAYAIFVGWFMDKTIAKNEYLKGTKWKGLVSVWIFLLRWIAPLGILLVILQESGILDWEKFFN